MGEELYPQIRKKTKMTNGNAIIDILMRRDNLTYEKACKRLTEARERLAEDEPEEILREEFNLESDYLYDLLG